MKYRCSRRRTTPANSEDKISLNIKQHGTMPVHGVCTVASSRDELLAHLLMQPSHTDTAGADRSGCCHGRKSESSHPGASYTAPFSVVFFRRFLLQHTQAHSTCVSHQWHHERASHQVTVQKKTRGSTCKPAWLHCAYTNKKMCV